MTRLLQWRNSSLYDTDRADAEGKGVRPVYVLRFDLKDPKDLKDLKDPKDLKDLKAH